jgi:hypothetical protein
MSSRQIKWLREQLRKKHPKPEEPIDEDGPVDAPTPATDLSILLSSDESPLSPPPQRLPPIEAPKPKPKAKPQKPDPDDDAEYLQLLALSRQREPPTPPKPGGFSMQSLNLVRELKSSVGQTRFDECLRLPKSASSLRFMARLKKWPKAIPQYFDFSRTDPTSFRVNFTAFGTEQSSIFKAFARVNDADGLLELGRTSHFVPPILPIACQTLLFQREFDSATEVALRGLFVLQQSLPSDFVPAQTRLLPSPARRDFLDLVAFLARFAFRRECLQTSCALWRFGLSLTDDDPGNFTLLAAVPALYAGDRAFIEETIAAGREWRGVPVAAIPDWPIARALLDPDDIEGLAKQIARWPFVFEEFGIECDMEWPQVLIAIGAALKRRITNYVERDDVAEAVAEAADLAKLLDETEQQAVAVSFWLCVSGDDIEFGDFVEEAVMPTG